MLFYAAIKNGRDCKALLNLYNFFKGVAESLRVAGSIPPPANSILKKAHRIVGIL